jgi:chromosome segregation protein
MDVTNLFLGTGVGHKSSYSIVEQGRIGLIVSARPQDRRFLVEEAAGITKFKAKKKAAERKMEYTQQNLLRINDIINEIQRSLASLKRQAQKAERYKRYRAEIRDLDLWIASHRFLELITAHGALSARLSHAEARVEGQRSALRVREAELAAERLTLQGTEDELERIQTRAYEADNAVKLLESQIEHYSEQLRSMREREHAAEHELEGLVVQRGELTGEVDAIAARLQALRDAEQIEAGVLAHESAELERRRNAAHEAELALQAARDRVAEAGTAAGPQFMAYPNRISCDTVKAVTL